MTILLILIYALGALMARVMTEVAPGDAHWFSKQLVVAFWPVVVLILALMVLFGRSTKKQ